MAYHSEKSHKPLKRREKRGGRKTKGATTSAMPSKSFYNGDHKHARQKKNVFFFLISILVSDRMILTLEMKM
jgi:hypothetical protein